MSRGRWILVGLIVVLILGGSSFWAREVVAGELAHSAYSSAVSRLAADLRKAQSDGLSTSLLLPTQQRATQVEARRPPAQNGFWNDTTSPFYNAQSRRLNQLDRALHQEVRAVTAKASANAHWILWKYQREIDGAQLAGLSTRPDVRRLAIDRLALARARTDRDFRNVAAKGEPERVALARLLESRSARLHSIISAAKASGAPIGYIRQSIRNSLSSAQQDLADIEYFDKHPAYAGWLNRTAHAALTRTKLSKAAVGAADVEMIAGLIHQEMNRETPAQWILVSTEGEWMNWYQHGTLLGSTLVTTGNPALPTPHGHFSIIAEFHPFTFVSQDPVGSPYYYPPSPVSYALEFQNQGYYIHDAPWRSVFGPGTDGAGQPGTNYGGSHGCVNVPLNVAAFLYSWAPMGTPVIVI